MMSEKILTFYQTHSPMTDPGEYAYLYDVLPDDFERLYMIIHNVLIHQNEATERYSPTSVQRKERYFRTMQQRLSRIVELDPSPLTVPREVKEKQIGYCRDFAVMMTSILRHKGIPARTRAGFGAYVDYSPSPPYRGDHWITEYWHREEGKWILIDAEFGGDDLEYLQELTKRPLRKGINFNALRANQDFYLAPYSWLACREGEIDINLYRHNAHWRGWSMLRGNLLHDFQALNNLEMGLFDYWDDLHSKPESEMTSKDRSILDLVAKVCLDPDKTFDEMRDLFNELPRTQVLLSRLHLIGILGEGEQETASDLLESDMARLIDLGEIRTASGEDQSEVETVNTPGIAGGDPKIDDDFDGISVLGARQNNLKNIDVRIPRDRLVVITGVSGSGKSSLAFDTIYAEGQRRYVESLSSFARQFMRQMEKPQVDKVIGLNPAVAIEQRTIPPNSRTTVGSITEVIDYLRILFARTGKMHCPQCGKAIDPQSAYTITNQLASLPPGTSFQVYAPLNRYGSKNLTQLVNQAQEDGFRAARINGKLVYLDHPGELVGAEDSSFELLVSEITLPTTAGTETNKLREMILPIIESALEIGKGVLVIKLVDEELRLTSEHLCPSCNLVYPKLEPRLLNANTIFGMCLACNGTGVELQVDPDLIITKPHRSILDDASNFRLIGNLRNSSSSYWVNFIRGIADYYQADLEKPWDELPEGFRQTLIYGSKGKKIPIEFGAASESGSFQISRNRELDGAIHHINRLYRQTKSESSRQYYRQFMRQKPCPGCNGEKLNKEARFVSLANRRFPEITDKSIGDLLTWIRNLKPKLDARQSKIAGELIVEIEERLQFICDVGLHYLTLNRSGPTLSGGEAQRIRLASQIGSELKGVLYVLDEPSIGLHPRDQSALLDLLCHLRDAGNTVLVVEHDADTMMRADWLIDMGPGAGASGGKIIAEGTPGEVIKNPSSLTGKYLSGELKVLSKNGKQKRTPEGWLSIRGARLHNLKSVDVDFPLRTFTCITGVSGSGKSSLVTWTLYPALSQAVQNGKVPESWAVPGPHDKLVGFEQLERVIHITQDPIGQNPRSNPGTYVGVLPVIRKLFAGTDLARERGYPEGHFSFNSKGGRCEACEGYGANKIKMHFMADVWVRCQECEGKRFMPHILEVPYRGRNIAEVLEMDVEEAYAFFHHDPRIRRVLGTLLDVGLGYLKLGQNATTLSGGEAQRVKLAKELSRSTHGKTLYILDEPTVGLHFADIQKLVDILHRLVDAGNSVMVIEHNLDVIRTADWVIDLGPEGGDEGGTVVAVGKPEEIAGVGASYTGQYLQQVLTK